MPTKKEFTISRSKEMIRIDHDESSSANGVKLLLIVLLGGSAFLIPLNMFLMLDTCNMYRVPHFGPRATIIDPLVIFQALSPKEQL